MVLLRKFHVTLTDPCFTLPALTGFTPASALGASGLSKPKAKD